jgi:hypothetical protein
MLIRTKDVQPGLVLARDLSDGGFVVLRKGAALTSHTIATIKKRGIRMVDVVDDGSIGGQRQSFEFADETGECAYKQALLNELFRDVDEHDGQMQTLRYCVMGQMEESFDNGQA